MISIRTPVLAALVGLLAACAGAGTTQTGCEQSTQTYAEMAGCLKTAVDRAHTPRPQYNPALSLYFAKEAQLSERVRTNQISDFDGRAELQRNYVTLMDRKAAP